MTGRRAFNIDVHAEYSHFILIILHILEQVTDKTMPVHYLTKSYDENRSFCKIYRLEKQIIKYTLYSQFY